MMQAMQAATMSFMETVQDLSTGMQRPRRAARQLEAVRRGLRSRRFFTLYFGLGIPPALFGSVGVAYRLGIGAGVVATVVVGAWLFETFATVCRRCPFYATTKCGLPGMVVPLLFGRRSAHDITRRRIAVHGGLDLAMVGFVNMIYLLALPALWPLIALCSVVGFVFVLRPKRFHGLAHRLRPEARHETARDVRPAAPVAVALRTRPPALDGSQPGVPARRHRAGELGGIPPRAGSRRMQETYPDAR